MTAPAPTSAALELRGVSKAFGPVVALRSGSLRVERGSIHALVGENGAGKSTPPRLRALVQRQLAISHARSGEPAGSFLGPRSPAGWQRSGGGSVTDDREVSR